jgi:hypothetical protein
LAAGIAKGGTTRIAKDEAKESSINISNITNYKDEIVVAPIVIDDVHRVEFANCKNVLVDTRTITNYKGDLAVTSTMMGGFDQVELAATTIKN